MIRIVIITSAAWLIFAVCCMIFFESKPDIKEMSIEDYRAATHAERIRLPDDAHHILASSSGFRDVHYTVTRFSTAAKSLEPFLIASRENGRYRDEKVYSVRDLRFSLDFLFDVFIYDSTLLPGWWVNQYSQDNPEAILMFWDNGSRGCGYIGLLDRELGDARIFYFSQQHLHWDRIERALKQHKATGREMKAEPNQAMQTIPCTVTRRAYARHVPLHSMSDL